jgi:hypothetical protein
MVATDSIGNHHDNEDEEEQYGAEARIKSCVVTNF